MSRVLFLTPPFVQLNTPYAATPVLTGFLRSRGVDAVQRDLSLEVALRLFSPEGLAAAGLAEPYVRTIAPAIAFLQGRDPACAWRIARRDFLPEGPAFASLAPPGTDLTDEETLDENFGALGIVDRAKLIASLYLDDVTALVRERCDPDFGLSRYAERLAVSAPSFDSIARRLARRATLVDRLLDEALDAALAETRPTHVGITIPFPGTVYAAFRIARRLKRRHPAVKVILGGGYVNSELRSLDDPRVRALADEIHYDEGFAPWLRTLGLPAGDVPVFVPPAYHGIDFSRYLDVLEMTNPLHRLWSDGKWLKMQLAKGCYWHRCAFCDVALDYIGHYAMPDVTDVVAAMIRLKRETGQSGFHFTDEALPPALVRRLSEALIASGETFVWWGNIRFDAAFTPALARLMARAGCIAVTGGLECAHDRLLKLMNKGITCAGARQACGALAEAGILVHAYLMYGFPTETRAETMAALGFVRDLFAEGCLQSAFWHRFALTAHSPMAADPGRFGIRLLPEAQPRRRFARNEIPYAESRPPDVARLGEALRRATYNYMLGLGLDVPIAKWFA